MLKTTSLPSKLHRPTTRPLILTLTLSTLTLFLTFLLLRLALTVLETHCNTSQPHFPSSHHQQHQPQQQPPASASAIKKTKPFPKCASTSAPAKTFLIVFMGNSASTAISVDLKNHPQVHMDKLEMVDQPGEYNTTKALEHTRRFFQQGIAMGKIPGFKIRPFHIHNDPDKWAALVKQFDTRLIWQYRKNTVKSALTSYIKYEGGDDQNVGGLKTNMTLSERCKVGNGCKYTVDIDAFYDRLVGHLDWTNTVTEAVRVLDAGRGCVWEGPYEDYLEDRDLFNDNVQRFLGIQQTPVPQERWKGTSDAICDVVQNWDEMCEKLYGCVVWQPLLEDPKNGCFCDRFSTGGMKYCKADKAN